MAFPDPAAPEAAVGADQRVEGTAVEDLAAPTVTPEASADADQRIEDATPEDGKHGDTEGNAVVTPEEMRSIIEVIADTGKFWHDWSFLKRLLSLHLKQVFAEYSDAQTVRREGGQQQNSLSRETYSELISQLNNAFLRFEEGPPFTLQRLCEILLDPKGTYTKLSKLALALEKNLLVTSTMTKCTDPYPGAHGPNSEGTAITGDGDEEMADAEAEVSGSRDVEMQEDKPDRISNVNSDANSGAAVTSETVNVSEKSSDPQS